MSDAGASEAASRGGAAEAPRAFEALPAAVRFDGVTKLYGAGTSREYLALENVSFTIPDREDHGEFASFSGVSVNPKPANGRVPIHVGGHTRKAAERAGQLGDGFFPVTGNVAELIDVMRQTAADAGRDPSAVEVTYGNADVMGDDPVGAVQELEALGVDRIVVPSFIFFGDVPELVGEFAERVIAPSAG